MLNLNDNYKLGNVKQIKLKSLQDKTGRYIMKEKMKVKIKSAFDGKVSNIVCHQLNELCGKKWTKEELQGILNSTEKCYLNEIGRIYMVDKVKVNYMSANYLLVIPKELITSTGKQLYVWLYRNNINKSFGKINIGSDDSFEYAIVENYYFNTKK